MMQDSFIPLLGVGDVPLWIVVSLAMGGLALIYLGLLGRGFARVTIIVLGVAVLAWAFAPRIVEYFHHYPAIGACIDALSRAKWDDCPYTNPYLR